ncbi:hypothetical protein ACFLXI_09215 [Chloroflexota bacterium]
MRKLLKQTDAWAVFLVIRIFRFVFVGLSLAVDETTWDQTSRKES